VSGTQATVYSEALPATSSGMRCQLVVVDGPDHGRAARIDGVEITVGTSDACQLVLTDDRVSGRHLAIRPDGERFVARDLGSKNGVVYEGSLITEATVSVGATFMVGRSCVGLRPSGVPRQGGFNLAEFDAETAQLDLEIEAAEELDGAVPAPPGQIPRAVKTAIPGFAAGI